MARSPGWYALLLLAGTIGCAGGRARTFAERRNPEQSGHARLAGADAPRQPAQERIAAGSSYRARPEWPLAATGSQLPTPPAGAHITPVSLSSNIGPSEPLAITPQNFEEVVLNSPVPVLIDCWAPWCGPCRKMGPAVDELADEFEGRAVVAKLDIDACPQIAAQYGVKNIPAFLYFQNGRVVDRVVGMTPKAQLGQRLAVMSANVQPAGGSETE